MVSGNAGGCSVICSIFALKTFRSSFGFVYTTSFTANQFADVMSGAGPVEFRIRS